MTLVHRAFPSRLRPIVLALMLSLSAALPAAAEDDPLEPFNRAMFTFNRALVRTVIDPVAAFFAPRLPDPVISGLGNAYSNLTEIEFLLNNLLVGDLKHAGVSVARFALNSTVGVGGLMDVATHLGLERNEIEFIESLCKTGLPPGPFVVLPFVGATNLFSAGTLAAGVALEVYALSFISTVLAAADFLVIDLGGSAATLRYLTQIPDGEGRDPYAQLRTEHMSYVREGCGPADGTNVPKVEAAGAGGPAVPMMLP